MSGENFVSNCINYGIIILINDFEGHISYYVSGVVGYYFFLKQVVSSNM